MPQPQEEVVRNEIEPISRRMVLVIGMEVPVPVPLSIIDPSTLRVVVVSIIDSTSVCHSKIPFIGSFVVDCCCALCCPLSLSARGGAGGVVCRSG